LQQEKPAEIITKEDSPDNGQGNETEKSEISIEDHKKQVSELKLMVEQVKNSQAGSDRAVADLKKENEELKKSKMSDRERADYEKQLFEQEKLNFERQKQELEASNIIAEYFAEHTINYKLRKFITAKTQETITTQVEELRSLIEEEVNKKLEKFRATETGKPSGGSVGSLVDQIDPTDISQVTAKYKQVEKEKGKDEALKWLETIKIRS